MQHVMAGQLGVLLARTGARAGGLRLLRQAYSALDAMFPGGHMHVADTGVALTRALLLTEPAAPAELAEAERVGRRALEIRTAQHAAAHPRVAEARCWLGIVLAARGRPAEANPLLRESIPRLERWGAADPADLAEARRRLSRIEAHAARR
jgi:hypothetical protein